MKMRGLCYKQGFDEPYRMLEIYDYRFVNYTNQEEFDNVASQVKEGDTIHFINCSVFSKIPNCEVSLFGCSITSDVFFLFNSKNVRLIKCVWTTELVRSLKSPNCCVTEISTDDPVYSDFGNFSSVKTLNVYDHILDSLPPFLEYLNVSHTLLKGSLKWPKSLKGLGLYNADLNEKTEIPKHQLDFVRIDFDCELIRHFKTKELELFNLRSCHVFYNRHVRKLVSSDPTFILYTIEQNSGIQDYKLCLYTSPLQPRIEAAIHQNRAIFRAAREATLTWMGLRLILRDVARIIGEFVWESRFERDIWI